MGAQHPGQPADAIGSEEPASREEPGFGARGRARRRARFLRKARELAYRDLGGLVFNLHRFGQRNDPLVLAKLSMLERIDGELRALEHALSERAPVTVLREAGITACPRCAAIHGSEDNFCPNCGLAMGRHADLPMDLRSVAGAATPGATGDPTAPAPAAAQAPAPSSQATGPGPVQTVSPPPAGPAAPSGGPPQETAQHSTAATFTHAPIVHAQDEPTEILPPPAPGP